MKQQRHHLFWVSIILGGLLSCGDDAPPPSATTVPKAKRKSSPKPKPTAAPTANTGDEVSEIAYAYSPIGKRDPFRSLFDGERGPESPEQLTELQRFEVDQLKLVGVVSRIATPYAMVEDPGGKGHTLTRGTLIGKNWGRVAEITPLCIVIKEEYRDYTGRKVTNKVPMCLPEPNELKLD